MFNFIQIKKYIINSADKKDIYFNLSNCLIINDNDDRAELIEEIVNIKL